MKDIKAVRGTTLLQCMVTEGEHEQQDFKYAVSDATKIARSLSAFANCRGGRLLIGVKDNGVIAGVRNEEDIYVVELAAHRYCRPSVDVNFTAYRHGTLHVIVARVEAAALRPICAVDTDGTERAYYRVADENIVAHPLMVRGWQLAAGAGATALEPQLPAAVLGEISRKGCVEASADIARSLHISQRAADEAVAHLAAMNMVGFRFNGRHFCLVPGTGEI